MCDGHIFVVCCYFIYFYRADFSLLMKNLSFCSELVLFLSPGVHTKSTVGCRSKQSDQQREGLGLQLSFPFDLNQSPPNRNAFQGKMSGFAFALIMIIYVGLTLSSITQFAIFYDKCMQNSLLISYHTFGHLSAFKNSLSSNGCILRYLTRLINQHKSLFHYMTYW